MLEYIEEYFKQYFNLDENLPDSYLMRSQYFIKERLKVIKKRAIKTEADMHLLALVFTQIDTFCTSKSSTYRSLLYIKRLVKELETIIYAIETIPEGKVNSKIAELLCYLNFNCSLFISYLITEIIANVNACESQNEKIERLAQYFKEYNQMPLKPNTAFKLKMQSIKDQLTVWISEELYFLEKKQRLLFIVPPASNEAAISDEDKIHFSTSVEILTLLARAAKDSKLILNKHNTSMYKSLVKFVRTAHTHNISPNSILKKGYVAERSAKQTAINILHEMIKHIHKY